MEGVLLTHHLVTQGLAPDEIQRMRGRGELDRVRRGAYVRPADAVASPSLRHHRVIQATVPQLRADAVISHASAAVLHSLPVWTVDLTRVHVTRPRTGGGGKCRSLVAIHSQPLLPTDVVDVDGIAVTSLARTVFDVARTSPFDRAVAAGDRALSIGMKPESLAELLELGRRWRGIRQAHRVAAFIDGRAESAGESVSRVRCAEFGLPRPEPQLPVALRNGSTAYGDLGWAEAMTIGEFDGKIKYGELLKPGESPADALVREKRREDMLRDLGWQVVRWMWDDLRSFGPVRQQLLAAFERGRRGP